VSQIAWSLTGVQSFVCGLEIALFEILCVCGIHGSELGVEGQIWVFIVPVVGRGYLLISLMGLVLGNRVGSAEGLSAYLGHFPLHKIASVIGWQISHFLAIWRRTLLGPGMLSLHVGNIRLRF
jgi:hypothetical protein